MEADKWQIFNFSIILVIIVLGLAGNIVSFIVFSKGKLCRSIACSTYFKCLAISDSFVLLFPGLQLLLFLPPISVSYNSMNAVFCKLSSFNLVFGAQVSAWIVVIVTTERTLTICRPLQFRGGASFFKPYWKIVSILLLFAGTNCFYLIDNQLVEIPIVSNSSTTGEVNLTSTNGSDTDGISTEILRYCIPRNTKLSNLYTIVSIGVVSFAIPLIINLTCNLLILYQLKNRMRNCPDSDSSGSTRGKKNSAKSINNFTYRVMAVSVVYCVSTGPLCSLLFIDPTLISPFVIRLFNVLYYVNSGVNFLLYCATGRDFRQDFSEIFLRHNAKKQSYQCTQKSALPSSNKERTS